MIQTDTPICVINRLVTNPDSDKMIRGLVLDMVIESLCDKAREIGYLTMTYSTNIEKVFGRFEQMGFIKQDVDQVHFGRTL